MIQLSLFQNFGVEERDRLYIIGNGFDIHHGIESQYRNFREWVQITKKNSSLIDLMDIFFSNDRDFWGDIENALGEYNEEAITDYCEPDNPEDFKYEHPGQWQDGVEGGISWVFGQTMDSFRSAFDAWVRSIDVNNIEADMFVPHASKYLTFNYTETLEKVYGVPTQNVLHVHGNRLNRNDEFVIGHGNHRDEEASLLDDGILLPYQNAYSEVIRIMNGWRKNPQHFIKENKVFFQSLNTCKGVCVLGMSYSGIDMPYLDEVAATVDSNCIWLLCYHSEEDKIRARAFAKEKVLSNYKLKKFD